MPTTYNKPSRYDYVSRKVFDKQVDRWTRKVSQLKEEIRILEQAIFKLKSGQETLLKHLPAHGGNPLPAQHGNEELD